jgi:hypothetical protein
LLFKESPFLLPKSPIIRVLASVAQQGQKAQLQDPVPAPQ